MEYVGFMMYAILGVCSTAFVVYILPALVMTILESTLQGWDVFIGWFSSIVSELRVHYWELSYEQGRHRKLDEENGRDFFTQAVIELREVNEGRRMPVSIRG